MSSPSPYILLESLCIFLYLPWFSLYVPMREILYLLKIFQICLNLPQYLFQISFSLSVSDLFVSFMHLFQPLVPGLIICHIICLLCFLERHSQVGYFHNMKNWKILAKT
jgi:hypothetical protein